MKKRFEEYYLWVQKTYNRKGYIAEVYRVDDRGRRCCILVPEGTENSGWAHFTEMLTVKKETTTKNRLTIKNVVKGKNLRSSSTDTDSDGKKKNLC